MDVYSEIIVAVVAAIAGVGGTLLTARYRENISTKKEQLQYFYAPMEILVRMNAKSYERYGKQNVSEHDRHYIEKYIWYPNHIKTKELIMSQSHHLTEMPEEILDLLEHINVWLSEYELIHVKGEKKGAVFAGPKGFPYPTGSDAFIYNTAARLRKELNRG
ncbi:hypothetical protein FKG94_25790 [Exilibacterium tricleocarpae]|uniref:DUF4760 domain-containing protein n=1 Tax=Exilibacterium tricleocarpae TaxID=2591008 RepID=A0A545SQU6_9GAMM|nr:hypothetical protein [Exilibacterium tricleocarpae]TQV67338.1 hypothetical protein FKG94_25790 [Exilibacterium tricleocarpae]